MLTFILGPSGSGKSRRMLAELRARAESGQRSLLIVPEQFTSSTEGTLYHILGDSLSAYVESYSFTSLAEALLRRYGGAAVETLSEAGRALLVRRAADSLLDKVVYYNRQRRSAAFCEKAAQTIEELKSAGITPDQLAAYARLPGADREKLEELSLIYGSYEAQLAQTAMDPGDRQQLAAQMLDASFFAGRAVYMDEFDTFNAPKRALLAAMLPAADVTVCLCCDGEQDTAGGMGLFSGAKQVAARLLRLAEPLFGVSIAAAGALRGAGELIKSAPAEKHLLILLTDASPDDSHKILPSGKVPLSRDYDGQIGVDDTAEEVRALRAQGIRVAAVFMGENASVPAANAIYGRDLARIRRIDQLAATAGRLIQDEIRELSS